jgi:hypothetical protein
MEDTMKRIAITIGILIVAALVAPAARAYEIPTLPQAPDIQDIPGMPPIPEGPGIPEMPEVPQVPIPQIPKMKTPLGGIIGSTAAETTYNTIISRAHCAFQGNTNETTCDLRKLGRDLALAMGSGEHTGYRVTIRISAGPAEGIEDKKEQKRCARERADAIRDRISDGFSGIMSPPSFDTATSKKANQLRISARVN